ncbi:MAG: APC family permease [Nitrospirota bacterium]
MGLKQLFRNSSSLSGTAPRQTLSMFDAVALIVGTVVGAGIFKTPSLVAAHSSSEGFALLLWLLGGMLSLIGALCYAELTSTYPHAGGDYHYISRAFGSELAFLFAWARITVIQTGSIAMGAFLVGDYASEVFNLGRYSASLYAALIIVFLTIINIAGVRQGKWMQNILTVIMVMGLLAVVALGFSMLAQPVSHSATLPNNNSAFGKAMIFVLLTYGGWNEAAYLSSEIRDMQRSMVRVLLSGISIITVLYLAANYVFIKVLGLTATAASTAVAADFMRRVSGEQGAQFISILIILAALSTGNTAIITGARTSYALGRDFALFGFLGQWNERASTPMNALIAQACIALGLIILGTVTRNGFATMVEYTAPVFWFFFLLVGVALFILRRKEPDTFRPFRVPLYPVTPLVFCGLCIYMLRSSLSYTGIGALVGVGVLLTGIPLLFMVRSYEKRQTQKGG